MKQQVTQNHLLFLPGGDRAAPTVAVQIHSSLLSRPGSRARTRTRPCQPPSPQFLERLSNQRGPRGCPEEPWKGTTSYLAQNNNFKAASAGFLAPQSRRDDGSQRRNQNQMNVIFSKLNRITASGLGPGGCVSGPEPRLGGPQRGPGSCPLLPAHDSHTRSQGRPAVPPRRGPR